MPNELRETISGDTLFDMLIIKFLNQLYLIKQNKKPDNKYHKEALESEMEEILTCIKYLEGV